MSDFKIAFAFLLKHEGGLEIDPNDPGGTTNFGISQRSYPNLDIRNLTLAQAQVIYERDFWIFGDLENQRIASKLFDEWVNSKHHAIRVAQLTLKLLVAGPVVADGNYGPQIEAMLNAVDEEKFIAEYKARLCLMHCMDAMVNPKQRDDLLGWLRRDVDG